MLVLTRRVGEEIVIDGDIRVTVLEVQGKHVRLGVTAPQSVRVLREEILNRPVASANVPFVRARPNSSSDRDPRILAGLMQIAR